jgi:two-component system, OmpR family, KDP operon response regulator KdpE
MLIRTGSDRDRVLVVDDDPPRRQLLDETFTAEGFEVTEAADAESLMEMVQERQPEVVLLQETRHGCTRLDRLRMLRGFGLTVPVVILSADVDDAIATELLEAGADICLRLPVSPRILVAHVRAILRRSRAAETQSSHSRGLTPEQTRSPSDPAIIDHLDRAST